MRAKKVATFCALAHIPTWTGAALIASLIEYGAVPEPFLAQSPHTLRRWQKERLDRFFREDVPDRAARFENLIALHLLKLCHFLQDSEGYDVELNCLRDRAGHETDLLVTFRRRPWFAVEAKLSETRLDPALLYFRERLRIPSCYQVLLDADRDFVKDGVRCLSAARFLAGLV